MGIFDSSIEIELQKIWLVGANWDNSTLLQNLFLILVTLKMVFKELERILLLYQHKEIDICLDLRK